jgi:hypothetical protein
MLLIKKVVKVMVGQSLQLHLILQKPSYVLSWPPFDKGGKIWLLEVLLEFKTVLKPS